jgi:hypothetical protein|tara:strand:- start:587 stop:787 length:201 start_codon:yes stop_codon:yes gene_type:complete
MFEQDIDEQLREMFAIHKDYFDQKEREVEGRRKINLLSTNREKMIGMIVEDLESTNRREFPTNSEK